MYYDILVERDNPTAYYKLDESGGTVAADSSGNGWDATYVTPSGGFLYQQSGLLGSDDGYCAFFDGPRTATTSTDHLEIPVGVIPSASITPSTFQFSFECWIATSLTTNVELLIVYDASGYWPLGLALGTTQGDVAAGGTSWPNAVLSDSPSTNGQEGQEAQVNVLTDSNPHHYVFTRTSSGVWAFYKDGSALGSLVTFDNTAFVGALTHAWTGISVADETPHFNGGWGLIGYLERVAIYNGICLTAQQVLDHYNAGKGGSAGSAGQSVGPSSDVSAGTWTPDSGSLLYPRINETVPVDTSYIQATAS